MKRITKWALILAGACFVLGLTMHGVGAALGGRAGAEAAVRASIADGPWNWIADRGVHIGGASGIHIDEEGVDLGGEHGVHIHTDRLPAPSAETAEIASFTDLEIELDLGDVTVKEGDGYSIALRCDEDYCRIRYKLEKGKLEVWSEEGPSHRKSLPHADFSVTVTVPKDAALDEVELSTSLGNVSFDAQTTAKSAELSSDLGDVSCRGLSAGELEAESSLGDVSVALPGNREDYRWELETDMGSGTLDGAEIKGDMLSAYTSGGSGNKSVKVSSNLGNVELCWE